MKHLISLASGALFGIGLVISGMTDTLKVQGFLDLFGAWDPSLIFVMGGAIIPMFIAWRIVERINSSMVGSPLPSPPSTKLDRPLIMGAVMFGMGWALSGLCPGPALASVSFGGLSGIAFMVAMLIGMFGFGAYNNMRSQ
jgi:uncharacterized membrane protein YedE/YeeE